MDIKQALNLLVNRQSLSSTQMQEVMRHLMSGECSASQIANAGQLSIFCWFRLRSTNEKCTLSEVEGVF